MKTYNADTITGEKELNYEQQLEHCFAQAKQLMEVYKEQSEENARMYRIIDEFIQRNDDLFERYIAFLKELKSKPEWSEYQKDIEYMLSEFGADEESENWLHKLIDPKLSEAISKTDFKKALEEMGKERHQQQMAYMARMIKMPNLLK